jgi:YjbE family integral membrane protein
MDMNVSDAVFWIALMQIIGVNIVLSGDNAVVIALAARSLPPAQQRKAIIWGSGAAVLMRIVLTIVAVEMLKLPYLKLVGAGLLMWIGVQLLLPEDEVDGKGAAGGNLAAAIRTILIADLVMSLDNVIAVAAAAKGSLTLLILGLGISIPLVIFGSTFLLKVMQRYPVIITIGAGLLGWVAGDMATTDPLVSGWITTYASWLHEAAEVLGAILVVITGKWLAAEAMLRRSRAMPAELGEAVSGEVARARAPVAAETAVGSGLVNRILLPVDASDVSAHAVEYALKMRQHHPAPESFDILVLNVQRGVPGDVSRFVSKDALQDYHRENSTMALERARKILDDGKAKYSVHTQVGKPWEMISSFASANQCDQIVMGTRGLGSNTGALLGSVAQGVAQYSKVPVLLVK